MKSLKLNNQEVINITKNGSYEVTGEISGDYTLISELKDTTFSLVQCNDTSELFIIDNKIK